MAIGSVLYLYYYLQIYATYIIVMCVQGSCVYVVESLKFCLFLEISLIHDFITTLLLCLQ